MGVILARERWGPSQPSGGPETMTRPNLKDLLLAPDARTEALTPEMALRVEKAFGVKMDTLLRMQARYDAFQMRRREAESPVRRFGAV